MEALATTAGFPGSLMDWPGLRRPKHLDFQQFLDALCISALSPPAVVEAARRAHGMPYPPHWSEELDVASGALYFYHALKDEASWQHPMAETMSEVMRLIASLIAQRLDAGTLCQRIETVLADTQQVASEELVHWVGPIGSSEDGGSYFYNRSTGMSEWEDPRERWRFDLQVRYELLVGFLVAEERAATARFGGDADHPPRGPHTPTDLTPTLTSLASTMTSVASLLDSSLTTPADAEAAVASADTVPGPAMWARPRANRHGGLPLPPRATSNRSLRETGGSTSAAVDQALFVMPPHQQQYASNVLQQEQATRQTPARQQVAPQPPPPPGAPPPRKSVLS